MEKVKWNKHFFQFTVPEKKMKKKKNAKVKFVGNGNQSEEKIDAEPQSQLDFPVMDQIKSPQNMSQKQVEYDIPLLFHFLTILIIVTFRFIIAKHSYESKKIKKKRPFQLFCNPEKSY